MAKYDNILVGTDYSPDADSAVEQAIEMARRHEARLHVLHCLKSSFRYSPDQTDEDQPEDRALDVDGQVLNQAAKKLARRYGQAARGLKVTWLPRVGTPYVELLRYARGNRIDLIVVGRTGESKESKHWGSTIAHLTHHAHCAVLVAQAQ